MAEEKTKFVRGKVAVDEELFMKIVDDAEKFAQTPEALKVLGRVVRAEPNWNNEYTALHYALSGSAAAFDLEKRKFAEKVMLDPVMRKIAARTLDGKYSAAASGMNEEIREKLNSTRSGRAFLDSCGLQPREADARSVGRLLKSVEDEKVRREAEKCAKGRDYEVQESIIRSLTEAAHYFGSQTMTQVTELVDSFDNDEMARSIANQIERRAPYIHGKTEGEIISNLKSMLDIYPVPTARKLLIEWSMIAYRSDWGDPEGSLRMLKTMQQKEVVEMLKSFDDRVMPELAECIAQIEDHMHEECALGASRAIAKGNYGVAALVKARELEKLAKELGNEEMMGLGWDVPTQEKKEAFIKAC